MLFHDRSLGEVSSHDFIEQLLGFRPLGIGKNLKLNPSRANCGHWNKPTGLLRLMWAQGSSGVRQASRFLPPGNPERAKLLCELYLRAGRLRNRERDNRVVAMTKHANLTFLSGSPAAGSSTGWEKVSGAQ